MSVCCEKHLCERSPKSMVCHSDTSQSPLPLDVICKAPVTSLLLFGFSFSVGMQCDDSLAVFGSVVSGVWVGYELEMRRCSVSAFRFALFSNAVTSRLQTVTLLPSLYVTSPDARSPGRSLCSVQVTRSPATLARCKAFVRRKQRGRRCVTMFGARSTLIRADVEA